MGDVAQRYRVVAAGFTERARAVPGDAWESPAPCEGWVARDVVHHLAEWVPGFFSGTGFEVAPGASIDDDPTAAWERLTDAIQAALDDRAFATTELDTAAGRHTFEDAIATFVLPDVLVHTWDLARATHQDETLDPTEVHRLLEGMESMPPAMDDAMRTSGHYARRVPTSDDAGPQTRLLAFTGRDPGV